MTTPRRLSMLLVMLATTWATATEPITVAVGESKTLNLGTLKKVSTGDPRIAEVTMQGNVITIKGVGNGKSLLQAWDMAGKKTEYDLVVGTPAKEAEPSAVGAVRFGGVKIDKADCDAKKAAQVAKACTPGADHAVTDQLVTTCRAAVEKEPLLVNGRKVLASLLAMQRKIPEGAKEYETYLLSCPGASDAKMVRKILDDLATTAK